MNLIVNGGGFKSVVLVHAFMNYARLNITSAYGISGGAWGLDFAKRFGHFMSNDDMQDFVFDIDRSTHRQLHHEEYDETKWTFKQFMNVIPWIHSSDCNYTTLIGKIFNKIPKNDSIPALP